MNKRKEINTKSILLKIMQQSRSIIKIIKHNIMKKKEVETYLKMVNK